MHAYLFVCNALLRQVLEQPLSNGLVMDLPYAAMSRLRHERHRRGANRASGRLVCPLGECALSRSRGAR